jgi:hypothetical protein
VQAEKGTIEKESRQALKFGGSPFLATRRREKPMCRQIDGLPQRRPEKGLFRRIRIAFLPGIVYALVRID